MNFSDGSVLRGVSPKTLKVHIDPPDHFWEPFVSGQSQDLQEVSRRRSVRHQSGDRPLEAVALGDR